MEVPKLSSNKGLKQSKAISIKKIDKDFAEEFNSAAKKEKENQIGKLLENIKKKGRVIIETRSIAAVREYKDSIKEYLSLILKDAYRVEKIRSMYTGSPNTLVEIINSELDKLAQNILVEEHGTIEVVNMIEHIEGLLIDIYQ